MRNYSQKSDVDFLFIFLNKKLVHTKFIKLHLKYRSGSDSRTVTFCVLFCQIFQKKYGPYYMAKTLLNPEIPTECYTFLTCFCTSPEVTTVITMFYFFLTFCRHTTGKFGFYGNYDSNDFCNLEISGFPSFLRWCLIAIR